MNLKTISARFGIPPYVLPIFIVVMLLVVCLWCFRADDREFGISAYWIYEDGSNFQLGEQQDIGEKLLIYQRDMIDERLAGIAFVPIVNFEAGAVDYIQDYTILWRFWLSGSQGTIFVRPRDAVDVDFYSELRDSYELYNNVWYFERKCVKGQQNYALSDPLTENGVSLCAGTYSLQARLSQYFPYETAYPIVMVFFPETFEKYGGGHCSGSEEFYVRLLDLKDGQWKRFSATAQVILLDREGVVVETRQGTLIIDLMYVSSTQQITFVVGWNEAPAGIPIE